MEKRKGSKALERMCLRYLGKVMERTFTNSEVFEIFGVDERRSPKETMGFIAKACGHRCSGSVEMVSNESAKAMVVTLVPMDGAKMMVFRVNPWTLESDLMLEDDEIEEFEHTLRTWILDMREEGLVKDIRLPGFYTIVRAYSTRERNRRKGW